MGIDALINTGVTTINTPDTDLEEKKTVVVMGVARSGTSMVARALSSLGIFMGENLSDAVLEDHTIFSLLENENNLEEFKKVVYQRDNAYKIWGWKRPAAIRYVEKFEPIITNPYYIIPFRDLLAIALRNELSEKIDFLKNLKNTHQVQYEKVIDFVENTEKPCLLFSYEKALLNPEGFIKSIIDFLKLEVSSEQIQKAVASIEPNRKVYLKSAKVIRNPPPNEGSYLGSVGKLNDGQVYGWAWEKGSTKPVEIHCYSSSNQFLLKTTCNKFRIDLQKKGIGNGHHGFSVSIQDLLEKGAKTSVHFRTIDGFELNNSPIQL